MPRAAMCSNSVHHRAKDATRRSCEAQHSGARSYREIEERRFALRHSVGVVSCLLRRRSSVQQFILDASLGADDWAGRSKSC
mmetsp:Transcript_30424/g.64447  ORF Transcript_30424/g.64447 Transcript_30424/m.64447 type:complete len:82 (-) Transcript_30424:78-323(-)